LGRKQKAQPACGDEPKRWDQNGTQTIQVDEERESVRKKKQRD